MEDLEPTREEMNTINTRALENFASNAAFDDISLQDKTIEPHIDDNWASYINRNWQLGNLQREDFKEILNQVDIAGKYFGVPEDHGGLDFVHMFGHSIMRRANTMVVTSNSVEGFGRKTLISKIIQMPLGKKQKGGWLKGGGE